MAKPNDVLESDVMEELDYDPQLDSTQIIVEAFDGKITLTGAVPTYYDFLQATDDAWSVGGVTAVDNELMVGLDGEALADADVAVACLAAMDADPLLPTDAVTVSVVDNWVTLEGTVQFYFQRQAANDDVSVVAGVRGVTDNITIFEEPIPSDVADRISRAFQRNAIIDDSLIAVSTSGHTVYLDGTTDSYAAMEEAVETAWQAPGVSNVVSRLVVTP